jgi:hypothetical protein
MQKRQTSAGWSLIGPFKLPCAQSCGTLRQTSLCANSAVKLQFFTLKQFDFVSHLHAHTEGDTQTHGFLSADSIRVHCSFDRT